HNYSDEQQAMDGGKMDQFVQSVGTDGGSKIPAAAGIPSTGITTLCNPKTVMGYYDGNATTALWNYAQHYAMSDNSYGTTFGPSAPGAINLTSGDTGNVDMTHTAGTVSKSSSTTPNADITPDGLGGYSLTSDAQPYWDDCSTRDAVALSGTNIGDELNTAGLSWGWFQGGFAPTTTFAAASAAVHPGQATSQFIPDEFSGSFTGKVVPAHASNQALCDAVTPIGVALGATAANAPWGFKDDYIPHHEPFQYYASTANPHHLAPASLSAIGTDTQSYVAGVPQFDTANHNYDTSDFDKLVAAINAGTLPASALPAVTFLKAPGYEDGHAQYSNPIDEQAFVVKEIDALEKTPDWSSTAVFINYDDSDGWYDHAYSGVLNPSNAGADNLTNSVVKPATGTSGMCGSEPPAPLANEQGRCGLGPRLPMIIVSPWAKTNYVDHNLSDQSSIINFIEYNWYLPSIAGSFDQALASKDAQEGIPFDLAGMFDFQHQATAPTFPLSPVTGQIDLTGISLRGRDLKGDDLEGAQGPNANIQGTNLQNAFLANVDFAGANLQGSNLQGAALAGADLAGANLQGSNLQGDDLSGANLSNATLQGANLERSNLTNANLQGANVQGANLHNVTWSNTICPDGSNSSSAGGSCPIHP
ncbi:MAG: pentapeptide repeat-containing protein, partial [Actinobacteria bacterium]|nr:pentapeptide repeat-containing protein [Actinomycetota bacterium]